MSNILGKMLSSSGRLFESMISDFEKATGNGAIDVDLIGDITTRSNQKVSALGLSPVDTLPTELVAALTNKLHVDTNLINQKAVGHNQDITFYNLQLTRLLNNMLDQSICRLGERTQINLLFSCPPVRLLKKLKLKTSDELIKKFNIAEVFVVAMAIESSDWQTTLIDQITQIPPDKYEIGEIFYILLDPDLAKIYQARPGFSYNLFAGTLVFTSYTAHPEFGVLGGVVDGLLAARSLIDESNQLQLILHGKDYSRLIDDWLRHKANLVWQIYGSILPWRSVYRVMSQSGQLNQLIQSNFPDLRLAYLDISDEIAEEFSELDFWADTDFLAYRHQNQTISLNLLDVISSDYAKFQYGSRFHFEEELWQEMLRRYLNQPNLSERVMTGLKININA